MNGDFFLFMDNLKNTYVYSYDGTAPAAGNTNMPKIWEKPKGCSFVSFIVVGGGGGGAGNQATANAAIGGGGGGGGAMTCALVPSTFCPEKLFILPGIGGPGASTAGTAGTASAVLLNPYSTSFVSSNTFLYAPGGSAASGQTAGGASTGVVIGNCPIGYYAFVTGQNGTAGTAGSSNTNATNTVIQAGTSGGAGGGGATGGSFTGGGLSCDIPGLPSIPGAGAGVNGRNGILIPQYFISIPGMGGGGNSAGTGGNGGSGGPGCGGGGGGGSSTGAATTGGNGGHGYVIISVI